jgi:hypothetical protein
MKALMMLVLALLVAGCAAGKGDGAGSATTREEPTATGTEETIVYKEETTVLAVPEPPDSTLSDGGREVHGTPGSFCWFSENSDGCGDASWPVIPSKQKTLSVPTDSQMVFRYGRQSPPRMEEVDAYSLKKLQETGTFRPDRTLKAHGSGVQRTIPASLPSGEYVLEVSVKEQQNDASYYFRIMVE